MTGSQNETIPMNARHTSILTLLMTLACSGVAAAESPAVTPLPNRRSGLSVEADHQIRSVWAALSSYRLFTGSFPSTEVGLKALVANSPSGNPEFKKSKEALPSLPLDPWGRAYAYSASENTMTLASSGPNPDVLDDDLVVIDAFALPGKSTPVPVQALPVVGLLRSVKQTDTARFQQCWSEDMAARLGLNDVSAMGMLERYKAGFTQTFGDYNVDEFLFSFMGTPSAGWVTVKLKNKDLPAIRVVQSGSAWKLGEK